jgi:hypothetical protein
VKEIFEVVLNDIVALVNSQIEAVEIRESKWPKVVLSEREAEIRL